MKTRLYSRRARLWTGAAINLAGLGSMLIWAF